MTYSDDDETRSDTPTSHNPGPETEATRADASTQSHHIPLPESIGHYRIESLIGEGGMGSVYKAEQDSPRRTVALKVIKAGVTSSRLLHRFEIEAQILGKLDHPGIATIFEAGTFGEGRGAQPFFAMEFVQGQELLEYADSKKLGTRDRLALLAKVAEAVQHAHQKGVIHRDLKPGNILVTDAGQIKVLDFGVARATDADIQTATMQTDIGQLIGTIPYMSPEQASGNPDDLDTRSDVYALGVIAYELLTGQMPYDLKQKMIHEAVRVIQHDEPKTLSTINRTFRGDVEIIVGKALIKEKDRRYQSASDLANDIERYLSNEPIEARPPSTWYQLSKFSRRNKALVVGIAAVLVVSVAGALISINFAMGEAEQKQLALDAAEQARIAKEAAESAQAEEAKRADELQQVADFQSEQLGKIQVEMMGMQLRDSIIDGAPEDSRDALSDSLASVNFTNIAMGTLEANIFAQTLLAIDTQFAEQPLVQAQMLQSTATTLDELGLLELATEPQERVIMIRRNTLGDDHPRTLGSINNLGTLLLSRGKPDDAEPYIREGLEGSRRVLGDDHPQTLASISNMGSLLRLQGKLEEAERYTREALEGRRRVLGDDHEDTMVEISSMGFLLESQGKPEEAEQYWLEALENRRRVFGDDHPDTLNSINSFGYLLYSQRKFGEAEPFYREALEGRRRVLGDDHPSTLNSINNMGTLLYSQGKPEGAEPYFREALAASRRTLGNDHPRTLNLINNVGFLLRSQGKMDEAEPYQREALEGRRRVLGDDHPSTLTSINNLGLLFESQGKLDEAESYFREAWEGRRRVLGDDHPHTLSFTNHMAKFLDQQGRWSESEMIRSLLVESARRAEPDGGARLGSALVQLGLNLIEQDRHANAEPIMKECLEIRKQVMPEGHWLVWNTQSLLGETLAKQSKFSEAEALLVEAAEQIQPPETYLYRRDEAIQRVIDLYTAWHAADPNNGYDTKAEQWRSKLTDTD